MEILDLKEEEKIVTIKFSVPSNEFSEVYNSQVSLLSKNLKIAGFRKGFIPKDIAINYLDKKDLLENSCRKLLVKVPPLIKKNNFDLYKRIFDCAIASKVESFNEITKELKLNVVFEKFPTAIVGDYSKIPTFYQKQRGKNEEIYWLQEKNGKATKEDVVFVTIIGKDKNQKTLYQYYYDFLEIDLSSSKLDVKLISLLVGSSVKDVKTCSIFDKEEEINLEIRILSVKEKVKITSLLVEKLKLQDISSEEDLKSLIIKSQNDYHTLSKSKAVIRWILGDHNKLSFLPIDSLKIKSLEAVSELQKKDKNFDRSKQNELLNSAFNENLNALKLSVVLDVISKKENIVYSDEDKGLFFKDVEENPWIYKNKKAEDFFLNDEADLRNCIIQFKTISFLKEKLLFSN